MVLKVYKVYSIKICVPGIMDSSVQSCMSVLLHRISVLITVSDRRVRSNKWRDASWLVFGLKGAARLSGIPGEYS